MTYFAFKDPWILFLLPFILGGIWYYCRHQKMPSVTYATGTLLSHLGKSWRQRFYPFLFWSRLAVIGLFIIALAGPRNVLEDTIVHANGVDIILAIDISGSMAAEDFFIDGKRVNRLEMTKKVVREFVQGRTDDRIGLIAFSGLAYTVSPLTTDYEWFIKNLERLELGIIKDGTAIGSAVAASSLRLQDSDAKSRIIILLTDGVNNAGEIDPVESAKAAGALGIKVYTIGVGSKGLVPFPTEDIFGRQGYRQVQIDLDEDVLREMAKVSQGQFFFAGDSETLRQVYQEIDRLEKTEIERVGYQEFTELFPGFLIVALVWLLIEVLLSRTLFMRIP